VSNARKPVTGQRAWDVEWAKISHEKRKEVEAVQRQRKEKRLNSSRRTRAVGSREKRGSKTIRKRGKSKKGVAEEAVSRNGTEKRYSEKKASRAKKVNLNEVEGI